MNAIEILIADSLADSLSAATFDGTIDAVDAVRTYVADYTTGNGTGKEFEVLVWDAPAGAAPAPKAVPVDSAPDEDF